MRIGTLVASDPLCEVSKIAKKKADEKRIERIFMNEFLLLALVIVYMVISYRPTSTEARSDQQNRHSDKASFKSRGADDN